jgi:hypothetical protein
MLAAEVRIATRDEPDISLEEVQADFATVRIQATPVNDDDGGRLADEVLAVVTKVATDSATTTTS